jgi:L-lactate dehydrogenase (cytochrome)
VTLGAAPSGTLQILSHVASKSLGEVLENAEDGQKIGWQLYMNPDRFVLTAFIRRQAERRSNEAEKQIRQARELGAQSIWLTVDMTIVGSIVLGGGTY